MQLNETLGDILRKKAEANFAATITREEARIQEQARQAAEERQRVSEFFNGLIKTTTDTIMEYKHGPHIVMGSGRHPLDSVLGFRDFFNGPGVTQEGHPHHEAWTFFSRWAKAQGLSVRWRHEHGDTRNDAGFPEESWYELEVTFL